MSDTRNDKASPDARKLAMEMFAEAKRLVKLAPSGHEATIQNERIKAAFAQGFAEIDNQEDICKQAAASFSKITSDLEVVDRKASDPLRDEATALGSFKGLVDQSVGIASAPNANAEKKPRPRKI